MEVRPAALRADLPSAFQDYPGGWGLRDGSFRPGRRRDQSRLCKVPWLSSQSQWQLQNSGFEGALRRQQRDAVPIELESFNEERARQDVAVKLDLLLQPLERGESYSRIV